MKTFNVVRRGLVIGRVELLPSGRARLVMRVAAAGTFEIERPKVELEHPTAETTAPRLR